MVTKTTPNNRGKHCNGNNKNHNSDDTSTTSSTTTNNNSNNNGGNGSKRNNNSDSTNSKGCTNYNKIIRIWNNTKGSTNSNDNRHNKHWGNKSNISSFKNCSKDSSDSQQQGQQQCFEYVMLSGSVEKLARQTSDRLGILILVVVARRALEAALASTLFPHVLAMTDVLLGKIEYWLARHSAAVKLYIRSEELDALDALYCELNPWYVKPIYKSAAGRNVAKRARRVLYKLRDRALRSCGLESFVPTDTCVASTCGVSAFGSVGSPIGGSNSVAVSSASDLANSGSAASDDDPAVHGCRHKLPDGMTGDAPSCMPTQHCCPHGLHTFWAKRSVHVGLLRQLPWLLVVQRALCQDPVAMVVLLMMIMDVHCTMTWCCRVWTAAILLTITAGSPLWARALAAAIGVCSPLLPPKMTEEAMALKLREFRTWAVANLEMLRGRPGKGLKGKLRQQAGGNEREIYLWIYKYESRCVAHPKTSFKG